MSIKFTATTVLNYSPRKARLVINVIRGMNLEDALITLKSLNKGKTKKIYNLLTSAASNLKLAENDYPNYSIEVIIAEEAQKLYRVVPRARGSAFRIRRRYSRIKVLIGNQKLT
ncbi:MAG: uL22 family ribosomal protein [Patescibacteria group bacterium]